MEPTTLPQFGTCSWKYDSWRGIVYPSEGSFDYLQEYSRSFTTVEIDQWFWSLFKGNSVVLPRPEVAREYADAVGPGFTFTIKVPNSITLTHHYRRNGNAPLIPNPYFLSTELMERFLESIEPLDGHIGPLLFQFEYLNRVKMPSLNHFMDMFEVFRHGLPKGYHYGIECRNPNFLKPVYFDFLADQGLGHVFLQGYYMPSIVEVYAGSKESLTDPVVIRLHGPNRQDIEKRTGKVWNEIVTPRDDELTEVRDIICDLGRRGHHSYINVNNHYEGCAPKTIRRLMRLVGSRTKASSAIDSGEFRPVAR